jgi:hypothetical protein
MTDICLNQVSIVAGYIKERTKNAQFIVISLRNNMFELAERLVGIYKVNHMTKSVTVENRDYLALQRQQARSQQQLESARIVAGSVSGVQQRQQQPGRPGTAGSGSSEGAQHRVVSQSSD